MNRVDKKSSVQVRIDTGLHRLIKIKASKTGETIKALVECFIVEGLGTDYQSHDKKNKQ